jgi:hypothetical protein
MKNANKKPQSRRWPRGSILLHVDARCEPYGRRFGSARNNKANRFSSSVTISLIYMARGVGSSAELPLATLPPIHRGDQRPAIRDFPVNALTRSPGYLTEATRQACNADAARSAVVPPALEKRRAGRPHSGEIARVNSQGIRLELRPIELRRADSADTGPDAAVDLAD